MVYLAVIGDIKDSRKIRDRYEVQKELTSILVNVNKRYKDTIESKFIITLGDEFQGLLKDPSKLLEILLFIKSNIFPVKLRFAIGIGEITTDIDPNKSIGSDGPAYYKAREAMDLLKDKENSTNFNGTNTHLIIGEDNNQVEAINTIFSLLSYIEESWTSKQVENIIDVHFNRLNQMDIAKNRGLNQSTISRSLIASGYNPYIYAMGTLSKLLIDLYREVIKR